MPSLCLRFAFVVPSLCLRSCDYRNDGLSTDLKRTWNGGGTDLQRNHNGITTESQRNCIGGITKAFFASFHRFSCIQKARN